MQVTELPKFKRVGNKIKTSYGETFLHYSKCVEGNHDPKIYIILGGVRYYMTKEGRGAAAHQDIEDTQDQEQVYTISLPTDDEISEIENSRGSLPEDGPVDTTDQPAVKWNPKYPGRKTKATFLNVKTGKYVSYIRAIQLKIA